MAVPLALLVEDDPANLLLVKMRLRHMGYDVVACISAFAALDALQAHPAFDLAVVDIRMPGMNGTQLIEHIRANPRYAAMPILVVSGEADPDVSGADFFLAKPYMRQEFEDAVHEAIRRHQEPS